MNCMYRYVLEVLQKIEVEACISNEPRLNNCHQFNGGRRVSHSVAHPRITSKIKCFHTFFLLLFFSFFC